MFSKVIPRTRRRGFARKRSHRGGTAAETLPRRAAGGSRPGQTRFLNGAGRSRWSHRVPACRLSPATPSRARVRPWTPIPSPWEPHPRVEGGSPLGPVSPLFTLGHPRGATGVGAMGVGATGVALLKMRGVRTGHRSPGDVGSPAQPPSSRVSTEGFLQGTGAMRRPPDGSFQKELQDKPQMPRKSE